MLKSSLTVSRSGGNRKPLAPCPNLIALAGDTYRVIWETPPGQRASPATRADPWLAIVPCRRGDHIYPFGPGRLAVFLTGRRPGLVKLLEAVGCQVRTGGEDGVTLTFPIDLFARVAEVVRAKRRRKLSPEHRARLIAAGRQFAPRSESKSPETGLISPPSPSVDLEVVPAAAGMEE